MGNEKPHYHSHRERLRKRCLKTGLSDLADYGDYWGVDWDFQDDTSMQGWVTYRIRKN